VALKAIKKDEFEKILKLKDREYAITEHAAKRAAKRFLIIKVFKDDLETSTPAYIFEQEHDKGGERKFDVYYKQTDDFYHRYIVVINDCVRLITIMRVSKGVQREIIGK